MEEHEKDVKITDETTTNYEGCKSKESVSLETLVGKMVETFIVDFTSLITPVIIVFPVE